ncbi:MAG: energy-coupling factor transporter transmembrane component T family protein [Dethiobacteria bacterium]
MFEYHGGETFVHNLDPRVKLGVLLLLTLVIFIVTDLMLIGILFFMVVTVWLMARLPIKILWQYCKMLLVLFVILIAMQALFYPGKTIIYQPLIPEAVPLAGGLGKISREGLIFGIIISFRLLTLVVLMPLLTMTTPVEKIALGLIKMGLPYTAAYTATITLSMIPILQNELAIIMDAQRLRAFQIFDRGNLFEKLKAYPALVIPLIIGSMRRAQSMCVAMDSRAFGASKKRTFLEDISMKSSDWVVLVSVALSAVLVVGIYYSDIL